MYVTHAQKEVLMHAHAHGQLNAILQLQLSIMLHAFMRTKFHTRVALNSEPALTTAQSMLSFMHPLHQHIHHTCNHAWTGTTPAYRYCGVAHHVIFVIDVIKVHRNTSILMGAWEGQFLLPCLLCKSIRVVH